MGTFPAGKKPALLFYNSVKYHEGDRNEDDIVPDEQVEPRPDLFHGRSL
jgi:hypothetical protein